jgi:hypothetical protein
MSSPSMTVTALGAVLTACGLALRLMIAKRRFDRRSPAGLQRFKSFWSALIISFLEYVAVGVSVLLMLAGILLLLVGLYN